MDELDTLNATLDAAFDTVPDTTVPATSVENKVVDTFVFDTGRRGYNINGYIATFNPVDLGFIDDFNDMIKRLGARNDAMKDEMKAAGNNSDRVSKALKDYRAKGTELFDGLLGDGATLGIFHGSSPFATQPDTRLPLWLIVTDYLSDIVGEALMSLPDKANTDALRASAAKSKALMQKYKIEAVKG